MRCRATCLVLALAIVCAGCLRAGDDATGPPSPGAGSDDKPPDDAAPSSDPAPSDTQQSAPPGPTIETPGDPLCWYIASWDEPGLFDALGELLQAGAQNVSETRAPPGIPFANASIHPTTMSLVRVTHRRGSSLESVALELAPTWTPGEYAVSGWSAHDLSGDTVRAVAESFFANLTSGTDAEIRSWSEAVWASRVEDTRVSPYVPLRTQSFALLLSPAPGDYYGPIHAFNVTLNASLELEAAATQFTRELEFSDPTPRPFLLLWWWRELRYPYPWSFEFAMTTRAIRTTFEGAVFALQAGPMDEPMLYSDRDPGFVERHRYESDAKAWISAAFEEAGLPPPTFPDDFWLGGRVAECDLVDRAPPA